MDHIHPSLPLMSFHEGPEKCLNAYLGSNTSFPTTKKCNIASFGGTAARLWQTFWKPNEEITTRETNKTSNEENWLWVILGRINRHFTLAGNQH